MCLQMPTESEPRLGILKSLQGKFLICNYFAKFKVSFDSSQIRTITKHTREQQSPSPKHSYC